MVYCEVLEGTACVLLHICRGELIDGIIDWLSGIRIKLGVLGVDLQPADIQDVH